MVRATEWILRNDQWHPLVTSHHIFGHNMSCNILHTKDQLADAANGEGELHANTDNKQFKQTIRSSSHFLCLPPARTALQCVCRRVCVNVFIKLLVELFVAPSCVFAYVQPDNRPSAPRLAGRAAATTRSENPTEQTSLQHPSATTAALGSAGARQPPTACQVQGRTSAAVTTNSLTRLGQRTPSRLSKEAVTNGHEKRRKRE